MVQLMPAKVESTKKAWGETRCVMRHFYSSVHHASIKKGGYSSRHKHEKSDNKFYVLSGILKVCWYKEDTEEVTHEITLEAGMDLTVAPNTWHRFEAVIDVELIETYCASMPVLGDDITRADTGGLKCQEALPVT